MQSWFDDRTASDLPWKSLGFGLCVSQLMRLAGLRVPTLESIKLHRAPCFTLHMLTPWTSTYIFLNASWKTKKEQTEEIKRKITLIQEMVCVCVFPFRKYPVLRKYPCCLSVTKWVPTMCQLWHIERHCGTIQIYMYMYMHIHIHHIHIRYNGLHL